MNLENDITLRRMFYKKTDSKMKEDDKSLGISLREKTPEEIKENMMKEINSVYNMNTAATVTVPLIIDALNNGTIIYSSNFMSSTGVSIYDTNDSLISSQYVSTVRYFTTDEVIGVINDNRALSYFYDKNAINSYLNTIIPDDVPKLGFHSIEINDTDKKSNLSLSPSHDVVQHFGFSHEIDLACEKCSPIKFNHKNEGEHGLLDIWDFIPDIDPFAESVYRWDKRSRLFH